jgi:hypothetical protein
MNGSTDTHGLGSERQFVLGWTSAVAALPYAPAILVKIVSAHSTYLRHWTDVGKGLYLILRVE